MKVEQELGFCTGCTVPGHVFILDCFIWNLNTNIVEPFLTGGALHHLSTIIWLPAFTMDAQPVHTDDRWTSFSNSFCREWQKNFQLQWLLEMVSHLSLLIVQSSRIHSIADGSCSGKCKQTTVATSCLVLHMHVLYCDGLPTEKH